MTAPQNIVELRHLERRLAKVRHRAEGIISKTHELTTTIARIREERA